MDNVIQRPKPAILLLGILMAMLLLSSFSFIGSPVVLHLFNLTKVDTTVYFVSRLLYWACLGLLCLYAIKVEKQRLLIWEEKKYTLLIYIASVLAIIAAIIVSTMIFQLLIILVKGKEHSNAITSLVEMLRSNLPLMLFTIITAGITEELIFRGYMLPRLLILCKNPYLAIFISSALFGAMHYKYGTIMQVAGPFLIGFICGFYYWKYRNMKVIIICHILWDLIAVLSLMYQHQR